MPKVADVSTVRSLITSVSALAQHLRMSNAGVNRWIKTNRLPGSQIVQIANYYDVEIADLIHLTSSDIKNESYLVNKSRAVLPALLKVYQGDSTLEEACVEANMTAISAKLILVHWGDQLPLLYRTLEELDRKEISTQTACDRLGVTRNTMYSTRRRYGYNPGLLKPVNPKRIPKAQKIAPIREICYDVVEGRITAKDAAQAVNISYRTIFRHLEEVSPVSVNELTAWPPAFRKAFSDELRAKSEQIFVQKWLKFAEENRLILKDFPKYPSVPTTWKGQTVQKMLISILLGDATLNDICAERGSEPVHMATLFTGFLRTVGLDYKTMTELGIRHQIALAELLIAMSDRKRKIPATAEPK